MVTGNGYLYIFAQNLRIRTVFLSTFGAMSAESAEPAMSAVPWLSTSSDAPAPKPSTYILLFRLNEIYHMPYRAMHYLFVRVRVPKEVTADYVATGEVAYCHNGKYGEFGKEWYNSGFHGKADVKVSPNDNLPGGVEILVQSFEFHYLGNGYTFSKVTLGPPLPNRHREQIAYHHGRKHKNPDLRIEPNAIWALVSRCSPESLKQYDKVFEYLLNCPEMPPGMERTQVSGWV